MAVVMASSQYRSPTCRPNGVERPLKCYRVFVRARETLLHNARGGFRVAHLVQMCVESSAEGVIACERRPDEVDQVRDEEAVEWRQIWQSHAVHVRSGQLAGPSQQRGERPNCSAIEAQKLLERVVCELAQRVFAIRGASLAAGGAERRDQRGAAGDAGLSRNRRCRSIRGSRGSSCLLGSHEGRMCGRWCWAASRRAKNLLGIEWWLG